MLYNNVIGKVIRKELETLSYEETTYNFEVEDNHNYYVGEECVLVHNECIKKLDSDDFIKRNGLNREEFHQFKRDIIKDSKMPSKFGKNPDIYYGDKSLKIYLRSTVKKGMPMYETNLTLEGWLVR